MQASACASPGKAEGGTGRPPQKEKKTGGEEGGARERPTAGKPPANTTRGGQTPHPEGTEDRTPKEAQGDHPAKTGNTKPGTAALREKGHQNTQTHTTLEKKKSQQPSSNERGWGNRDYKARDRDSQRPTPQSRSKTPPPPKKTHPDNPIKKGGTQQGRAHKHAPPHSTPNQEVQETTRDGRTSTLTPQHPPKERRGAAETKTPARTTTPHTGTGNGRGQAERARNHARPICRPKTKPNHGHHKHESAKEGRHHKPYPNTPARDPSQDWRG